LPPLRVFRPGALGGYEDTPGINSLVLAGVKCTPICVQRSSILSSIGIIGSELPIQKSCKPVLAA
jgi:hypothetical protein